MENIKMQCSRCEKFVEIPGVNEDKNQAILIGRAFGLKMMDLAPELPAEYREMYISGICPTCWDSMFAPLSMDDDAVEESSMELA